ncbi:unnamed protein product [Hermetia illucens]|uniref:TIL domain-containing protein n=1 Tax=Hermetia illucens TaxID=343691 RepID=A0A7R8UZR1_HERIL|nr:chymotrypsin inhibitor Ani s 6-like [Hermetia illucens]CAD7088944.1 unnamed protein product [Hermetia illucens]
MKPFLGIALLFFVFALAIGSPALGTAKEEKLCPANEVYYDCGPNCQSECDTLGEPCTIRYIRCPDGCYCKKNYARMSPGGECVPIEKCPAKKVLEV